MIIINQYFFYWVLCAVEILALAPLFRQWKQFWLKYAKFLKLHLTNSAGVKSFFAELILSTEGNGNIWSIETTIHIPSSFTE